METEVRIVQFKKSFLISDMTRIDFIIENDKALYKWQDNKISLEIESRYCYNSLIVHKNENRTLFKWIE